MTGTNPTLFYWSVGQIRAVLGGRPDDDQFVIAVHLAEDGRAASVGVMCRKWGERDARFADFAGSVSAGQATSAPSETKTVGPER